MKISNSFKAFALAIVWGLGSIGGTLVAVTSGYWLIGIAVAGVAAMALPSVIKMFKDGE
jgi:hypothetical protein